MEILACPHCAGGTKCLTRITTSEGYRWIFLRRYASCGCRLSAQDKARLIEQAEQEVAHAN
jgi:uncharacterized protein YbaR (Trm112 family)